MKSKLVLCVVTMLVMASIASAGTIRYKGSGSWDQLSVDDGNGGMTNGWQSAVLPGSGDTVRANWGGATISLNYETTVGVFQAGVDESGTFHIQNGGILNAIGNSKIGNNNNCTGTMIVDAGATVNANGNWLMIAGGSLVTGVADISGTLDSRGHLWMATGADSTAILDIQSGGTVSVGGMIGLGTSNAVDPSGGIATINIQDGGLLSLANIHGSGTSIQDGSMINLLGSGKILMEGDYRGHFLNNYIPNGTISGDGIIGNVEVDFDGVYTTVAVPEPATMLLLGLGGMLIRKRR